jgi:hypothetical protein
MRTTRPTDPCEPSRRRWRIAGISHATVVAYLALFMAMGGTAFAATGGTFTLGKSNSANQVSTLTSTTGTALSLRSPSGEAPLAVNRSVVVKNLNADLLDGYDSTRLARLGTTNTAARTTLANPDGVPLRLTPKAGSAPLQTASKVRVANLNADLLDGKDSTAFAAEAALSALQVDHAALKAAHDTLKTDHTGLQAQHVALRTEFDALAARVAEIEEAAGVPQAQFDALKAAHEEKVAGYDALLAGMTRVTVDGQPTLRIAGVNLQLVNGSGLTHSPNGVGNLIIGYSAQRDPVVVRSGSHYLVIGDQHQWTGTGGIVAGEANTAAGTGASALGGRDNTASGYYSVGVGGEENVVSGWSSVVTGGLGNEASGPMSAVWGGAHNLASAHNSAVAGGDRNRALGSQSTVFGGKNNTATGEASSILGGFTNTASSHTAAVAGGELNEARGPRSTVLGGKMNTAFGEASSILGGHAKGVTNMYACHPGCS